MTTPNLAKIERVDLREAWPNEARDFTPWLADNIAELGEALGMDLELQQTEASVGGYSLDVLATDLNQNRPVIIENQLETTNHDHLGKLLTYAAGYDANVIVWLTREFRDEHRQALDWLNQRTGEDTEFFGVEVELWRIGDSPFAPHFKLVATPNEWRKAQIRTASLSPREDRSREFRQRLIEAIHIRGFPRRTHRKQSAAPWVVIEYPIPHVRYAVIWHNGIPGVEMIAERAESEGREWSQKIIELLRRNRSNIESDLISIDRIERFAWEAPPERSRGRVAIYRDGNVYQNMESWDEFQDWMIQKLHKFREVITPRLQEFAAQEQTTLE